MYKPGELIHAPERIEYSDYVASGYTKEETPEGEYPLIFLPHSCNEWIIGGAQQARELIKDLEAAIVAIEG